MSYDARKAHEEQGAMTAWEDFRGWVMFLALVGSILSFFGLSVWFVVQVIEALKSLF